MNRKNRTTKSLCEKSMKMVVNAVKLSSFSLAKMKLGTFSTLATTRNRTLVTSEFDTADEPLLYQSPRSRKSEKPQSSMNPVSFLMQPDAGNEASSVVSAEGSVIDAMASDYIHRFHEKNKNGSEEPPKISPFILPPPPRW